MEDLKFVCNEPAVLYKEMLIVADLHLGMERSIFGSAVEMNVFGRTMDRLLQLVDETNCNELVLLGDVKHDIPNMEFPEREKLGRFLRELNERVKVSIVMGNHDGGLREIAEGIEIHGATGVRRGNISLSHGHAWPSESMMGADWLVLAHNHPCVELTDKLGYRSIQRVWVVGKLDAGKVEKKYAGFNSRMKVVVMPAFSELVGGMVFNAVKKRDLLGPLFRNEMFKLGGAETFLLNGISLGIINDIKQR
ncbi:metallophosphoesterase [Candidatus Micrarchaeota archaeon]|nr:metallophosphoesterase [Candidatus Micrarchaeota archaeon]